MLYISLEDTRRERNYRERYPEDNILEPIIDYKLKNCSENIIKSLLSEFYELDYGLSIDKRREKRDICKHLSEQPMNTSPRQLTEEERIAIEREERLHNLRSGIYSQFGYYTHTLQQEEMEKLLGEEVEPSMAKWYLFLREKGIQLTLPSSMDGEFSALVEEAARDYITGRYGDVALPLEALWDIEQLSLGQESTKYVIRAVRNPTSKNFPLGRTYVQAAVTGLRERLDPITATQLLVYGLIGKRRKNLEAAYKAFDSKKLEEARKQIRHSHLTPQKIFTHVAPSLEKISQGDITAARQILDYLNKSIPTEEISDLVSGVEDLFSEFRLFSYLTIKMQDGVYGDMYDNSRLMACTFLPKGSYRGTSIIYYYDPDIGLLHTVPQVAGELLNPVGVAILLNALDSSGNKWLVVDSVEGGTELERVRASLWMPATYNGIVGVGTDINAKSIIFNSSVFNGRPKKMIDYIAKQHQSTTVYLEKAGLQEFSHFGLSAETIKEAFETWKGGTKGEVNGHVVELRR